MSLPCVTSLSIMSMPSSVVSYYDYAPRTGRHKFSQRDWLRYEPFAIQAGWYAPPEAFAQPTAAVPVALDVRVLMAPAGSLAYDRFASLTYLLRLSVTADCRVFLWFSDASLVAVDVAAIAVSEPLLHCGPEGRSVVDSVTGNLLGETGSPAADLVSVDVNRADFPDVLVNVNRVYQNYQVLPPPP